MLLSRITFRKANSNGSSNFKTGLRKNLIEQISKGKVFRAAKN